MPFDENIGKSQGNSHWISVALSASHVTASVSKSPIQMAGRSDFSFYFQAAVLVHIYTDGSVLVAHGGVELGQGINTKMIQVREVGSLLFL